MFDAFRSTDPGAAADVGVGQQASHGHPRLLVRPRRSQLAVGRSRGLAQNQWR